MIICLLTLKCYDLRTLCFSSDAKPKRWLNNDKAQYIAVFSAVIVFQFFSTVYTHTSQSRTYKMKNRRSFHFSFDYPSIDNDCSCRRHGLEKGNFDVKRVSLSLLSTHAWDITCLWAMCYAHYTVILGIHRYNDIIRTINLCAVD